jgi:hypothetical protein
MIRGVRELRILNRPYFRFSINWDQNLNIFAENFSNIMKILKLKNWTPCNNLNPFVKILEKAGRF